MHIRQPRFEQPHDSEDHVHHGNYVKIWAILVVLLIISVLGPLTGIRWLVLFTAFGIAIIKAYMVAKNFMHVNVEQRWVRYLLITCLVFLGSCSQVWRRTS